MKVINQVIQTSDYAKFGKLLGNRAISKLNVKRLKDSFEKGYLLSPIMVNEKFQIIDGQHRFEAAKELGLPINYIMQEGYGLKEVQTLNANMEKWKKKEYLDSFVDLGYPAYLEFKRFMNRYPAFGIASCESLLMNKAGGEPSRRSKELVSQTNKTGSHEPRSFQKGELEIYDYNLACENAEKIIMMKPYYSGYNRTAFVRTMVGLFKLEQYTHSKLLKRLAANPTVMQHCGNVTQYKVMIEEIYNHRSRIKVSLRF